MCQGIILYGLLVAIAATIYRFIFQQKFNPSISRRVIWDILCFSFILIPFNRISDHRISDYLLGFESSNVIIFIYLIGVGVLSINWLINCLILLKIRQQSIKTIVNQSSCYIHNYKKFDCFSWMNKIFLPKDYEKWNEDEIKMVLNHETGHVYYSHWLDLLFIQLLCIFQWFNPAIWYWRKELMRIHEFEADKYVVDQSDINKKSYQYFLLRENTKKEFNNTFHSFNSGFLKQRILMMNNKSAKKDWVVKGSTIFIAAIVAALLF